MRTLTDGEREVLMELNDDPEFDWTPADADDDTDDDEAVKAASEAALEAQHNRDRTDFVTDEGDTNHEPF